MQATSPKRPSRASRESRKFADSQLFEEALCDFEAAPRNQRSARRASRALHAAAARLSRKEAQWN